MGLSLPIQAGINSARMIGIQPDSKESSITSDCQDPRHCYETIGQKMKGPRDLRSRDLAESKAVSTQKLFMYRSISQSCTQVL
jgi:hypothetical protein